MLFDLDVNGDKPMSENTNVQKISCLAVLRAGYTGDNFLIAHMRLVMFLIYKRKYVTIEVQQLIEDFFQEYQYSIGYFPMLKILSIATEKGCISRKNNRKKYYRTEKTDSFSSMESEVINSDQSFCTLAQEYVKFCKTQGVEYSEQHAEEIVSSYIHSQKLEHITGHIKTEGFQDKRIDYLFGKFVYHLKEQNTKLFSFLNNLVIGSILVDCLVFHDQLDNEKQLDGLTVVIDTSPVFIALGIDSANRTPYYLNLFESLKHKGVHLSMFQHSYDEMQQVLNGAKNWINNHEFDPSKASITAEYFRDIGATRNDIDEFSISLKQKITDLGIDIISIDYNPQNHPYQIDGTELRQSIVDLYRSTNHSFNEAQQTRTIDLDVKSIVLLYHLRKEQKPFYIHDANYIFLTANQQIAKVAADYHHAHNNENTLPTTLTDVFLGTYIWLSNPIQIAEMNERQIMAHAYIAFQPSTQIQEKLSASVESLLKDGLISSDLCYALRGSKLVAEKLAQKTLNDPDAYTEVTPLEIIEEFKSEAAAEERKQNMELLEKQRIVANEKQQAIKQRLLEQTKESLQHAQDKIDSMTEKNVIAKKTKKHWRYFVIAVMIAIGILLIAAIITYIIFKETDWYSPVISIITSVIPLVALLATYIYYIITQKELSPQKMIDAFLSKKEKKKLDKLGYSQNDFDALTNQIASYEENIQTLTDDLQQ